MTRRLRAIGQCAYLGAILAAIILAAVAAGMYLVSLLPGGVKS